MGHIGIGVHNQHSPMYILRGDGELIERRVRTEATQFAVLGSRPRAHIVIESVTESEWVARCLEASGYQVIVADPNFAPSYAQRHRKVKTDRRAACTLAEARGPSSPGCASPPLPGRFISEVWPLWR